MLCVWMDLKEFKDYEVGDCLRLLNTQEKKEKFNVNSYSKN